MKWWNECRICGAVVAKSSRHREWHEQNGDEPPPKSGSGGAFWA